MNLRRFFTTSALAFVVIATPLSIATAQEISDSHMAAARKAISAIEATDRFDAILPNVALAIKQQLIANNPDLEAQINDITDTETLALVSRRSDLENAAAEAYAKAIGEEDLIAIAEFYNSDAGQVLLKQGAIISRQVQQAAGVWQRGIERDLLSAVTAKLREVAPRSADDKTDDAAAVPATDAPATE